MPALRPAIAYPGVLHLKRSCFAGRLSARRKMSWTCHGTNNEELVNALKSEALVKSERAIEAMRAVDRGLFCLQKQTAYRDAPQGIGFNATISAPHMHAICLDLLERHLTPGSKVLDIGSGSGYLTAIMAYMVHDGQQGKAVGVEHIPELAEKGRNAAQRIPFAEQMLREGSLEYITGDGLQGYEAGAPYDAIHVGASASSMPQALINQLKRGGRLVVPCGEQGGDQSLQIVDKDSDGNTKVKKGFEVRYVPLTSREAQLR